MKVYKKAAAQLFFLVILGAITGRIYGTETAGFESLNSLDLQNENIKSLRSDVRAALAAVKRGDPSKLPTLKFYKYKVKQGDNFWKILSKTSLNIDTLSSINSLSSPDNVLPGKEIYLSNMRGIVYKVDNKDTADEISKRYNVGRECILKVNKITDNVIGKEYIFIPLGEVSNLERSLFLGVAFASPLEKGRRTSGFGRRADPFNNRIEFHPGVDLACPLGSNVHAARKGRVIFTGYEGGYGLLLVIRHEHGYTTYYGHLRKVLRKPGDPVERGDIIALSGESGRCTGPHLHFEVRKETKPVNPGVLVR